MITCKRTMKLHRRRPAINQGSSPSPNFPIRSIKLHAIFPEISMHILKLATFYIFSLALDGPTACSQAIIEPFLRDSRLVFNSLLVGEFGLGKSWSLEAMSTWCQKFPKYINPHMIRCKRLIGKFLYSIVCSGQIT